MKEKLGITVDEWVRVIGRKRHSSSGLFFNSIALLCSWIGMMGIAYGFLSTYQVRVQNILLAFILLLICIIWTFVFFRSNLVKYTLPAVLLIYGLVIYRLFPSVMSGTYQILNGIIVQLNQYYQTSINYVEVIGAGGNDVLLACTLLLFIPAGLVTFGIVYYATPWVLILLGSIPCMLALAVGTVPPVFPSSALLFGVVGVLILHSGKERRYLSKEKIEADMDYRVRCNLQNQIGAMAAGILLVIVLAFAASSPLSLQFQKMSSIKDWVQNSTVNEIWRDFSEKVSDVGLDVLPGRKVISGGMSGGKMGRADRLEQGNDLHLIVTSSEDIPGKVYLKGFTGSEYESNRWNPSENSTMPDGLDGKQVQSKEYNALSVMNRPGDGIADEVIKTQIQVENAGASRSYVYVPYYSDVNTEENEAEIWDATIERQDRRIFDYNSLYWNAEESRVLADIQNTLTNFSSGFSMENQTYQQFVYSTYLQMPKEGEARLRELVGGQTGDNLSAAVTFVKDWLAQNMEYTVEPGATPDGEDFVQYFLFEKKKGFCMHFASAATLMFRAMGIPARYAEGYIAADFQVDQPKEIPDANAHAWTEIWIDSFGWVPIETTPGFDGNTIPQIDIHTDSSQADNSTETEIQDETTIADSAAETQPISRETIPVPGVDLENPSYIDGYGSDSNAEDGIGSMGGQRFWNVLKIIMKILVILAISAAIIFLHRKYRIRLRQARFCQEPNLAIGTVLKELIYVSQFIGVPLSETMSGASAQKKYSNLKAAEYQWLVKAAKEARFSTHRMKEEDRIRAVNLYEEFCKNCLAQMGRWKKIIFCYWHCFYP